MPTDADHEMNDSPPDFAAARAKVATAIEAVTDDARARLAAAIDAVDTQTADDFGEWVIGPGGSPYVRYSDEVGELRRALSDARLIVPFDWSRWNKSLGVGRDLPVDDPVSAVMSLTAILRAERFNEGSWLSFLKDGLVSRAVRTVLAG